MNEDKESNSGMRIKLDGDERRRGKAVKIRLGWHLFRVKRRKQFARRLWVILALGDRKQGWVLGSNLIVPNYCFCCLSVLQHHSGASQGTLL